jgi:hypothetical protein
VKPAEIERIVRGYIPSDQASIRRLILRLLREQMKGQQAEAMLRHLNKPASKPIDLDLFTNRKQRA